MSYARCITTFLVALALDAAAFAADSPLDGVDGPVGVRLVSDCEEVPNDVPVSRIEVIRRINEIASATVVILDGNAATQEFPLADSKLFAPGAEIEIRAGYGTNDGAAIFKGIVVAQKISVT